MRRTPMWFALFLIAILVPPARAEPPHPAENVIVVTLDGFRWQELFTGADEDLLNEAAGGVRDVAATTDQDHTSCHSVESPSPASSPACFPR